nr:PREDICTED: protein D1-like isoform X2 [Bemisia tabaci]
MKKLTKSMPRINSSTRTGSSEFILFLVALIVPRNWASPYGNEDEPFHRNVDGRGNEFEPTAEYNEETYPIRHPRTQATIRADLIRNEIIPEFFLIPPRYEAFITYYDGIEPNMGNTLKPQQVRLAPHTVTYKFKPDTYYCIVMTGLDEPSKATPTKREFLHWIVGNILADSLLAGDHLAEYYPVLPKNDTGSHRYLFLVYEQKGIIDFKEPPLTNRNSWGRANWSNRKFAEKYKLGEPHAVNFFYSEFVDLTPTTTPEDHRSTKIYTAPTNKPI